MIRIMFCLTLLLLFIACDNDEQSPNSIVTPQPYAPTDSHTEQQNQKIENIEHVVGDLMQEWQQIKTDLDAGVMPDIDSLKSSVDTLLNDLGTIQQELEKLTTLINASGGDPAPSDDVRPPKVDMPSTMVPPPIFASEIVFQSDGSNHIETIHKISSDGTNRQQLTFGHGRLPKWSPDGQQIAFISMRFNNRNNLFIMNPDGSDQRLAGDPDDLGNAGGIEWFDWFGDDVFLTIRHGKIFINGIQQERLIRVSATPAVSPGGQIAFVIDHPYDDPHVYITLPFGGGVEPLIGFGRNDENPAFSPDGAFIAFKNSGNIFVANAADGTARRQLTFPLNSFDQYETPTWSPDGRQIAFAGYVEPDWNWEIYVINSDGTNRRNITNTPGLNEQFPDWSPR